MISASRHLGKEAMSLAHLFLDLFGHSSGHILAGSVRLDGEHWYTAIFSSFHTCSIGFRSGLWLGHSKTFTDFLRSHSFVLLAVCFGSLSCWKVNLCPRLWPRVLWSRFSSRILVYFAAFIFLTMRTIRPVPAAEKHLHIMMLPPLCFTVGMVLAC